MFACAYVIMLPLIFLSFLKRKYNSGNFYDEM